MYGSTSRGIKAGGLQGSVWATGGGSSKWPSRGNSSYVPRTSSGVSSSTTQVALPAPPSAPSGNWWENTPAPVLKGSAKPTPAATPTPERRDFAQSQRELRRYVQIVRRMKWKLPYLEDGYRRAIGTPRTAEAAQYAAEHPPEWEKEREEAELHFKLDFFEYYMLLERALVHLLSVFNSSVAQRLNANGKSNGVIDHSYHRNVLLALQDKDGQLYEAMGSGDVLRHLTRAKDLRNRWKHAEDTAHGTLSAGQQAPNGRDTKGRTPLESYDLVTMFNSIFSGFDAGYGIADKWVEDLADQAGMVPADNAMEGVQQAIPTDAEEYNFIFDAMDWEAV